MSRSRHAVLFDWDSRLSVSPKTGERGGKGEGTLFRKVPPPLHIYFFASGTKPTSFTAFWPLAGSRMYFYERAGSAGGFAVGEYIQFAAEGPFLGKRGFSGSRDLADMQSLDARGEVTEAHVADGVGILGDNLLNRAVGSLEAGPWA